MPATEERCLACKEPCELSWEHIIPASIGGRLTDRLYCKACNATFGYTFDKEIANQFGFLTTILNIARQRGKLRAFEVIELDTDTALLFNGQHLRRKDPIVRTEKNGKRLITADITARSEKELRQMQDSLAKKYEMTGESREFKEEHAGPVDFKFEYRFDTELLRRAITKIAYSFLCHKLPREMVLSDTFEPVRSYIRIGDDREFACSNFAHTGFMVDHIRPLHKVHISLNRQNRILVGYVSLFGTYRYTVLLASDYASSLEWADLDYTYDPVRQEVVEGRSLFRAPPLSIQQILRPKQSREFVRQEIIKGLKAIHGYIQNLELLKFEIETAGS